MTDNEELLLRMSEFDKGDPKRIQHFFKVYEYAHLIGIMEGIPSQEQKILDAAAILHDIGIIPSEMKYGHCNGKMQEKEGPAYAERLLREYGRYSQTEIDRICFLIAHHHTYKNIDGKDYRILIEADFIVNACEEEMEKEKILVLRDKIFRTSSGIRLLNIIFGLN